MSEILVGDVLARLRADATQFNQAIQDAIARLGQLTQAQGQLRQQQAAGLQSASQLTTASQSLAQSLAQQTSTYTQAQGATAQYRQQQDQLRDSLRRQREEQREATAATQQAGGAFQSMLAIAGGIGLATGIGVLVAQLKAVLVESVTLSAKMQDLHLAFRAIDGSASAANKTMGFLFETAQRLGVDFERVADGFKRMDAAAKGTTLQGEAIRTVFTNIIAGARMLGTSSEQTGRALVALEQILSKGKVSAEEYRGQLAEAIPGALQLVSSGMGVTTQIMEQMIQSGLIPADAFVVALAKSLGDLAAAGTGPNIERLSGTFAQLKNETLAWMTALGDGISEVLQPFLRDLIAISAEARKLLGLRGPGQQSGAGGGGGMGLGPLTPRTLGFLPPNPYMPSEFEETRTGPAFAPSRFDASIQREAIRNLLDPILFSRLIQRESSFNPQAVGPATRSGERALGLGQIMPGTGRDLGLTTYADFFDPEKNLAASAKYLHQLNEMLSKDFTDLAERTKVVLAAYNAGIGNVKKAMEETRAVGEQVTFAQVLGRLPKPQETGPYVEFITGTPNYPAPPVPATSAEPAPLDPYATMVTEVEKALAQLPDLQKQFESLTQSSLNFGGVLGESIIKQADELTKKFTDIAELLARIPNVLSKMTPVQREQLELAAQQVAVFQQQILDQTQTAGGAAKRIQELRAIEQLQAQLDQETAQEVAQEALRRRQEQWRDMDIFGLSMSPEQEQAYKQDLVEMKARRQAIWKELDPLGLDLTPDQERSRAFGQRVSETLAQLRTPRDERTEERYRRQAAQAGIVLTPEQEERLSAITAQERLNAIMQAAGRIGDMAAQTITTGLLSIIDGTQRVGEGFQAMAKSILDSIAKITLNEGFKQLISLGLGVLASAITPAAPPAPGLELLMAQGGAIVNKPTTILAGENPAMNPEYVLNRPQMQALMRGAIQATPSAGGQAAGVTIINVASQAQAEQEAARERSLGRQVVVNYVMEELAAGEGSRIGRMLRAGGR